MSLDALGSAASSGAAIPLSMLKKGMDQEKSQIARLLQTLPPAPQPAHLGSQIDIKA